jgi:hypothetical protein
MKGRRFASSAGCGALSFLLIAGCQGGASTVATQAVADPSTPPAGSLAQAYARLISKLDTLTVSGAVKTSDGILLPETIRIEVHTEVCAESRPPGSRFWSLDYDTCFTFVSVDTVDANGTYTVAVPCLDADRDYQESFSFGDLRLVPKGPVAFLADSDGGWRHQETFTSSRSQQRDLILSFEPHSFFVIAPKAEAYSRPQTVGDILRSCAFGEEVKVIRFHAGWAECLFNNMIGWVEMKGLGTEEDVKEKQASDLKETGSTPQGNSPE